MSDRRSGRRFDDLFNLVHHPDFLVHDVGTGAR